MITDTPHQVIIKLIVDLILFKKLLLSPVINSLFDFFYKLLFILIVFYFSVLGIISGEEDRHLGWIKFSLIKVKMYAENNEISLFFFSIFRGCGNINKFLECFKDKNGKRSFYK